MPLLLFYSFLNHPDIKHTIATSVSVGACHVGAEKCAGRHMGGKCVSRHMGGKCVSRHMGGKCVSRHMGGKCVSRHHVDGKRCSFSRWLLSRERKLCRSVSASN